MHFAFSFENNASHEGCCSVSVFLSLVELSFYSLISSMISCAEILLNNLLFKTIISVKDSSRNITMRGDRSLKKVFKDEKVTGGSL